jgi:hypothetical protein
VANKSSKSAVVVDDVDSMIEQDKLERNETAVDDIAQAIADSGKIETRGVMIVKIVLRNLIDESDPLFGELLGMVDDDIAATIEQQMVEVMPVTKVAKASNGTTREPRNPERSAIVEEIKARLGAKVTVKEMMTELKSKGHEVSYQVARYYVLK